MRIHSLLFLILLPSLLHAATNSTFSDTCMYKVFPIFAGGSSDEYIRCMVYDDTNDLLITAGKTSSNDFAPA